jgi:hypothetical protein
MPILQRIKRYGLVLIAGIGLLLLVTYYLGKEDCCLEEPSSSGKDFNMPVLTIAAL